MLCLVNSGCARVFSLLNSVTYDCSLILSVSASWPVNSFKILRLIYSMQLQFSIFVNYLFKQLQFQKISELFCYAATVFFWN